VKPPNSKCSEVLERLSDAERECEQLIKEVEEYNWAYDAYPLGLGFIPYPEKDMDHFHARGRDARNLKTRIVAILRGLGSLGDAWRKHIEEVNFYESYELDNPFLNAPKRPSVSGLTAAREVLRSVIQALRSASLEDNASSGRTRSVGSPQAVKACERYMDTKGLTQAKFGESFGTTDRTVRKFLASGKMKKALFRTMAESMGLSPEQLRRGEWP
jgi:hypothetical protein